MRDLQKIRRDPLPRATVGQLKAKSHLEKPGFHSTDSIASNKPLLSPLSLLFQCSRFFLFLFVSLCLSIYLASICLVFFVCLFVFVQSSLSVSSLFLCALSFFFVLVSLCLSVCLLSAIRCLSVCCLCVCALSVFLCVCLSCLCLCLRFCLFVCVCLPVCHLSVSFCLFVYLAQNLKP